MKKNKTLALFLKLAVAAAALWWVFSKIEGEQVLETLGSANYLLLAMALLFFVLSKITAAFRLNIFFRNHQIHLSEKENLKLYWLGMFYNIFLPGGISGDGYKIYLLRKSHQRNLKELFTAVLVDRMSGVVALSTYALILFAFIQNEHPYFQYSWFLAIPAVAGFWILFEVFFKRYLSIFTPVTAYSFLVQGLQIVAVYFILSSFGITQQVTSYIVVFLISSIVAIIPVSVGGAGTRELAFMLGAKYLALSPETSVTISLTFYLLTLLTSLFGLIYVAKPPTLKEAS